MSIVVFGSINMDLVVRTPRLPLPGETITGITFQTFPGGKGANQAVACARLGAETRMVGRVGGDMFGETLKAELKSAGVDDTLVDVDAEVSSGVALIAVDDQAENNIIIIPGANGRVEEEDLPRLDIALENAQVLLLQLEIPLQTVVAAAKLAGEKGVTVILDPAPARELPEQLFCLVDIITPNEVEAAMMVGFPVESPEETKRASQVLLDRGVKRVVIKMGGQGAYTVNSLAGQFYPAIPVTPIDTVAAGDAFNGALAVALSEGRSIEETMLWAVAAGALSVTKEGAQPAMPDRGALEALLAQREERGPLKL